MQHMYRVCAVLCNDSFTCHSFYLFIHLLVHSPTPPLCVKYLPAGDEISQSVLCCAEIIFVALANLFIVHMHQICSFFF